MSKIVTKQHCFSNDSILISLILQTYSVLYFTKCEASLLLNELQKVIASNLQVKVIFFAVYIIKL